MKGDQRHCSGPPTLLGPQRRPDLMGEPSHEPFQSTPSRPCDLGVPSPPPAKWGNTSAHDAVFPPTQNLAPSVPKASAVAGTIEKSEAWRGPGPLQRGPQNSGAEAPSPLPDGPQPGGSPAGPGTLSEQHCCTGTADARGTPSSLADAGTSLQLPRSQQTGGRVQGGDVCRTPAQCGLPGRTVGGERGGSVWIPARCPRRPAQAWLS